MPPATEPRNAPPHRPSPPPPNTPHRPVPRPAPAADHAPGPIAATDIINGKHWEITKGRIAASRGELICLYGTGGIGKTTLAALAPNPVILDVEGGSRYLDCARLEGINSWKDLRGAMQSPAVKPFSTIILDSITRAEALAIEHTLETVPTEKGNKATSIEGYGYGKGFRHVYETFQTLMGDIRAHIREGRTVVLIAHDCTTTVPNPAGEDYLRYEPRLQGQDKTSIRLLVKEACDHLLYLQYNVTVGKDGVAYGGNLRTIFPVEQAHFMAKSRSLREPIAFEEPTDNSLWQWLEAARKGEV